MRSWHLTLLPLVLLSISLCHANKLLLHDDSQEKFYESLTLKPLVDGKVSASFEFQTNLRGVQMRDPRKSGDEESQHYTLYPLSLGQILRTYSVSELHLTLNAGKWDYDHWGLPHTTEFGDVATGATFWAWIGEGGDMSIDEKWKGLRNALAGLFCSSLGRMDEIRTTSPSPPILASDIAQDPVEIPPQAFAPYSSSLPRQWTHHLRHATLPSENVCTENLTPFLKLLPCKGKSGIASLLNPHKLFDANWHGLGVHVTWEEDSSSRSTTKDEEEKGKIEVKLTFQAVLDPLRKPSVQRQDFSLDTLFARQIHQSCPVASLSTISLIDLPPWSNDSPSYTLTPSPTVMSEEEWPSSNIYDTKSNLDELYIDLDDGKAEESGKEEQPRKVQANWNLYGYLKPPTWGPEWQNGPLNVGLAYTEPFDRLAVQGRGPQGPVSLKRTLTEKSQLSGRLDVEIVNHDRMEGKNPDGSIDILYLETMPWIVQFYLHTLVPKINGVETASSLTSLSYTPSIPHSRPTTFQAAFHIPANSTLSFTMDITKAFLRYTEHPPDAQRGWDLPPAVVVLLEPSSANSTTVPTERTRKRGVRRLYTPTLLITLATPDFSMPYNVIIFTSTVAAFIFASVFNLLTRRFVVVDLKERGGEGKN